MNPPIEYLARHQSTVEYLAYQFDSVTVNGEQVDAPSTYQIAAVPSGQPPTTGDYHTAPWLAGPLQPNTYDVYVKFVDNSETPVRYVAQLTVF